jgi:hypothetical protein
MDAVGVSGVRVDCGPDGSFSVMQLTGQNKEGPEGVSGGRVSCGGNALGSKGENRAPDISGDEGMEYKLAVERLGDNMRGRLAEWLLAAREMVKVSERMKQLTAGSQWADVECDMPTLSALTRLFSVDKRSHVALILSVVQGNLSAVDRQRRVIRQTLREICHPHPQPSHKILMRVFLDEVCQLQVR